MSRYDGLIIPRGYNDYISKTDAATLLQALQLSGVMDNVPTTNSVHPVKSGGIKTAIDNAVDAVETSLEPVDTVTENNMRSVTSNAVARVLSKSRGTVTYNSNVLQGSINWYRVGNCVYVRFERVEFLEYTGDDRNISADDQLPRPLYGITVINNIPPLNANVQSQLITVTPQGALGLGGGHSVANQYFYGGFTYLCSE